MQPVYFDISVLRKYTFYKTDDIDDSDPELKAAIKSVTDSKNPNNWCVLGFAGETERLEVVGTGTGGLKELKTKMKDWNSRVLFGTLLVVGVDVRNNVISRRDKFVHFSYVGTAVPELVKARSNFQKNKIRNMFGSVTMTMELHGGRLGDQFTEKNIATLLLAAGAAHKPNNYDFGGGNVLALDEVKEEEEEQPDDFD